MVELVTARKKINMHQEKHAQIFIPTNALGSLKKQKTNALGSSNQTLHAALHAKKGYLI